MEHGRSTVDQQGGRTMTPANMAKDFEGLKGLTDIAIGASFLAGALAALVLAPTGWAAPIAPVIGVLVLILAEGRAERFYRDRVGSATSVRFAGSSPREFALIVLTWLLWLVAFGVDALEPGVPVLILPALAAGTIYLLARQTLRHVGLTPVHVLACLGLILVALLPLVVTPEDGLTRALVSCAAVGVALVLTGLADHRRLMAALRGRRSAAGEGA